MTEEQYRAALKTEKEKYDAKVLEIQTYFAFQYNKIRIGDYIFGKNKNIKVTNFHAYLREDLPILMYEGMLLTKQGKEYKNKKSAYIFPNEILRVERDGKELCI